MTDYSEMMHCWDGKIVTADGGATWGEIIGDYWDGNNQTGATRMLVVAYPSKARMNRMCHIPLTDAVFNQPQS